MNVLIDICHPAHVHLFKYLYFDLIAEGHNATVTVREIPSAIHLLKNIGIPFVLIGKKYDSLIKKGFQQFQYLIQLRKIALENSIDLAIGTSINITHLSLVSSVTSVVLDDDDDFVEPLFVKFGHPFADFLLTPDSITNNRKRKKRSIFHPSTHECAYLHPNRFNPDKSFLRELGLESERYFILRFNAFKAHHDVLHSGIAHDKRIALVELLSKYGHVLITTEGEIDPELSNYQIRIPPEKIHHALYFADMFVGDSQTMTTEAGLLGTPAFKCNTFAGLLSVPNELEHKYELCYSFQPNEFEKMLIRIEDTIGNQDSKSLWATKKKRFFSEKIDLTSFMNWFIISLGNSRSNIVETVDWNEFK